MSGEIVYFIQIGDDGPIKIGITKDINRRVNTIAGSMPFSVRLLGTIDGGRQLEYSLHQKFSRYHIKNEWFYPNNELLSLIEEYSKMPLNDSPDPDRVLGRVIALEPKVYDLIREASGRDANSRGGAESIFRTDFADRLSEMVGYKSSSTNPALIATDAWTACRDAIVLAIVSENKETA